MSVALRNVPMPPAITRKMGFGYLGYRSSVPAHLCPLTHIWGANTSSATPNTSVSYNLLYDPQEGKFFRRAGSTPIGGTDGILETGATGMRARQLVSLSSESLRSSALGGAGGDGYPTHCVLYTNEATATVESQLYLRSTIGSINYVLGQEFNATNHYPGTTAATFNIKCIPYSYLRLSDATGAQYRLNTAAARRTSAVGSRRMLDSGGWLYLPNFDGTPMRWNKQYNESTSSGSQNLRFWHTGPIPPLKMPTLAGGTVNANGVWQNGDLFFTSVVYQRADGSCSAPIIPRDINDILTSGLGRVSLTNSYDYLDWSGIPIGPDGTVGRWLLRTPKFNSTSSTGTAPAIRDLRVVDYIANNTATTYRDFFGNDLNLKDRPDIVRFDRIMPPPARYIGSFDGRAIIGYTRRHTAGFYLCPDVNASDDDASLLTTVYEHDPSSGGAFTLYKDAGSTVVTAGTNQQMVDRINATVSGGGAGKWWAQLAPGVDGSATHVTLGGISTGDTSNRMRAFATSYPGVAAILDPDIGTIVDYGGNKFTHKARWFYTQGGPDAPSMMADSYLAGNYRTGQDAWGILMGFAPLPSGALIFFSKAMVVFDNQTTGKSGLDEDYHPRELFTDMGCIAWDSIIWGNGWVGCLTEQGLFVFDKEGRRRNISGDLWNSATSTGDWSYEIPQCAAATAADNDSAHFHAKVMGNRIYCTWRSDSSVTIPNRMAVYDFSQSASQEGIGQVLRPDGTPWGWSTGLGLSLSVLGEVRKSTGTARYGCNESNAGTTNGRVDQFETGTTDNGTAIAAALWGPIDFSESLDKKAAQEVRVVHKANSTGIKLHFRRTDGTTTALETGSGLALPTTGASGTFAKTVVPLPQTARSQAVGHQIEITDDGSGTALEVWGAELDLVKGSSY